MRNPYAEAVGCQFLSFTKFSDYKLGNRWIPVSGSQEYFAIFPAPSEPYVRVSQHRDQASASMSSVRRFVFVLDGTTRVSGLYSAAGRRRYAGETA